MYFICFCAYILLKQHEENKVVCQTADIQQEREGHGGQLLIHFDGWTSRYDYWAEYDSPDLHPIGFMAEVGFQIPDIRGQIQPPKGEYLCRVLVYVHTCMYVCIWKPQNTNLASFTLLKYWGKYVAQIFRMINLSK